MKSKSSDVRSYGGMTCAFLRGYDIKPKNPSEVLKLFDLFERDPTESNDYFCLRKCIWYQPIGKSNDYKVQFALNYRKYSQK